MCMLYVEEMNRFFFFLLNLIIECELYLKYLSLVIGNLFLILYRENYFIDFIFS